MMLPIARIGKVRKVISASSTSIASRITIDADQRQHAGDHGHDAVGDERVERLDVVGHPRDQHAGPVAGVEADRHRLQVGVDPLAQVLQRPLADPADEVGLHVGGRPVDRRPRRGRRSTISVSASEVARRTMPSSTARPAR